MHPLGENTELKLSSSILSQYNDIRVQIHGEKRVQPVSNRVVSIVEKHPNKNKKI